MSFILLQKTIPTEITVPCRTADNVEITNGGVLHACATSYSMKTVSYFQVLKVEDQMTRDDILHEENLKKGQNKYSTLRKVILFYSGLKIHYVTRQIKSGSTEARISFFEQL